MNAKLCKRLRREAYRMCLQPDGSAWPTRHLIRSKVPSTAINDLKSWRGTYRWLKRNHAVP